MPAPHVSIQKNITTTSDGTRIGSLYDLVITGTISAIMGSPASSGGVGANWGGPNNQFWQLASTYPPNESIASNSRLAAIESKQAALRALFATDGFWLEFESPDGSAPLKCQPRITNISFAENTWYDRCEYTISCNTDKLYLNGNPEVDAPYNTELVSAASEQWNIEEGEVSKTYRLVHTCSATGKRSFDDTGAETSTPWLNAKTFIQNRFALGFNNTTSFSTIAGKTILQNSFTGSGNVINFSTLNPYDYSRVESVDELGGTYSLTESWIMSAAASGTDVYNIQIEKIVGEPTTTTVANINGVIKGFFTQLGDYDGRFAAAQYVWGTLQGTPLLNRVQTYVSNVTLNTHPMAGAVDYNPLEGTINYNYRFSDKIQQGTDAFEEYSINKKVAMEDYRTTVGIAGKITGRLYESDTGTSDLRTQRALQYWKTINSVPILYNRIINSTYFPEVSGLRQYPSAASVDVNSAEGIISYNYEFTNRQNDNDLNDDDVFEDYTVGSSFSREEGRTVYSINGTIEGLKITDVNPRAQKYNSASNYFNNVVQTTVLSRVITYANAVISNPNPIEITIEKNPTLGKISYGYKYSNEPAPFTPGALSEVITVTDSNRYGQVNVFAAVPVIGRNAGPVLQGIGTTKEKVRTLDIEIVVVPTGTTTVSSSYALKPNTDLIVSGVVPVGSVYLDDDVENWTWNRGRYSRNVRWVYQ